MNIQEMIELADQLIVNNTGKHLDDLQIIVNNTGKHLDDLQIHILKEAFDGQKYAKIAKNCNCSEGYIKTVASELWKILSDEVGEAIKKSNFKSTMERFYQSHISDSFNQVENSYNVNICNNGYSHQAELNKIQEELDAKIHRIQELEKILSINN